MFFVFVRDDVRSEAELRLEFGEFHVFGELAFSLHLLEILIVLIFIFGVWDFDHVFVEEAHELRSLHRFFYFLQLLPRNVLQFQVGIVSWLLHFKLFKLILIKSMLQLLFNPYPHSANTLSPSQTNFSLMFPHTSPPCTTCSLSSECPYPSTTPHHMPLRWATLPSFPLSFHLTTSESSYPHSSDDPDRSRAAHKYSKSFRLRVKFWYWFIKRLFWKYWKVWKRESKKFL